MAIDPANIQWDGGNIELDAPPPPKKENAIDQFILEKFGSTLAKAPDIQGSIPGRIIQGAADLPVGAMQLGMNIVGLGDKVNPEIAAINRRTEQLRGPDAGFDFARLLGGVAMPMGGVSKLAQAATTGGRIGRGAAIGAGMGALSPVTTEDGYLGEKMGQIAGGALVGGVLPGAWELSKAVGRGARNVFQPLMSEEGAKIAAGRLAREVAGDKVDDVIAAMTTPRAAGFRGMTAGQAAVPAGSAEFSALQQIAEKFAPSEYAAIDKAQQGAREGIIEKLAGGPTDERINNLIAARSAATKPLYQAVEKGPSINVTGVVADLDKLITGKPGNTELVNALNEIKRGLAGGVARTGLPGMAPSEAVSSSIDGIKAAIAKKDNAFIQGELVNLREKLKDLLPSYRAADTEFKRRSIPINQMAVARELQSKLASPTGAETAGSFLRALDDSAKIIKDATGMSRYKELGQVMNPAQVGRAKFVAQELENNLEMRRLAGKGSEAARNIIGDVTNPVRQTNLLNRAVTIFNDISSRLEGKATQRTMQEMAAIMQDPQEMARYMLAAKPFERKAIVDTIMSLQAVPAAGAAAQDRK